MTDTSGLVATVSNLLNVGLLKDVTPPTIASVNPASGPRPSRDPTTCHRHLLGAHRDCVGVYPTSTSSRPGTSGVFDGTETEVPITGFPALNDDTQVQLTTAPLANGHLPVARYHEDGITDRRAEPARHRLFTSNFTLQVQTIQNAGFETGNLTGWTSPPPRRSERRCLPLGRPTLAMAPCFPQVRDALRRAQVGQVNVYETVSQQFTSAGFDTITGFAFFDTSDYLPFTDYGHVRITDAIKISLAAHVHPRASSTVGELTGETPWTKWQYTFTDRRRSYRIEAGSAQLAGYPSMDSYLGLDAVQLVITASRSSSPEPRKRRSGDTSNLTQEQLQPVVTQAIAQLATAGYNVSGLGQVQFHVADLAGSLLGLTRQNTIWIDQNAQGYGWYIDASPSSNAAFTQVTGTNEVQAAPGSPAYGHVDLLTVVTHELGHVLGFASIDPGILGHDWMTATLATGVRRYPDAARAK